MYVFLTLNREGDTDVGRISGLHSPRLGSATGHTATLGAAADSQFHVCPRIRTHDLERLGAPHEHAVAHCCRPFVRTLLYCSSLETNASCPDVYMRVHHAYIIHAPHPLAWQMVRIQWFDGAGVLPRRSALSDAPPK